VAIIDTGIDYNHSDLYANYAGGYDFVNSDDDPMDDNGHGTHVAGIIAAEDNDEGVVGVAPEASLYALKVLDSDGSGYVSEVIFAIQWASDPDGDGSANDRLDIINMSLGADRGNIFLKWACNLAYIYPAAYYSVIAVSATDSNDTLASFSSTGKQVELAAPGVSINSTLLGGGYGEKSGTSMASPHVAGVAALVWANPANSNWTNEEVRAQLQNTAEDLGAAGWDSKYGYGLVDADEAVGVEIPPPGTGTIAGNVIDISTGLAIAKATVDIEGTSLFGTTETNGDYTIVDVAEGIYTVTASAAGYENASQDVTVIVDTTTTANFALNPLPASGTMYVESIVFDYKVAGPNKFLYTTVKVVDGGGVALEGVRVEMALEHELKGPWDFAGDTDIDGMVKFTLKKAPSGEYTATVTSLTLTGYKWDKTKGKIWADHTL
jgi:subtilisin family serine protease